jgi:hypothetical protein
LGTGKLKKILYHKNDGNMSKGHSNANLIHIDKKVDLKLPRTKDRERDRLQRGMNILRATEMFCILTTLMVFIDVYLCQTHQIINFKGV